MKKKTEAWLAKLKAVCWTLGCVGILMTGAAGAATLDIITEFKADIRNPGNNEFKNVTPLSGFCGRWPKYCPDGVFSIMIPGLTVEKTLEYASWEPEKHTYLAVDGRNRDVVLTNTQTGDKTNAQFRLAFFSKEYTPANGTSGLLSNPPVGGCSFEQVVGNEVRHTVLWKINPEKVVCYTYLKNNRSDGSLRIQNISIGFALKTGKPLELPAGNYEGEVVYTVGNGMEVDLGGESYSDNEIRIRIKATVEHAFYIKFPRDNMDVHLTPPGGWSTWVNGGVTPQKLSSEVPFALTSSGTFKVSMQCEYQEGQGCGLKDTKSKETVPLDVRMTVPGFVSNKQLVRGIVLSSNAPLRVDPPGYLAVDLRSKLDFQVGRKGVEKMVKSPGSEWKGVVTLIFDSDISNTD